jgi:hypothetical protein
VSVDKILKLIKLSESPADNEALSAIRKAHELVRKNGLTWDLLIEGFDEPVLTPQRSPPPPIYDPYDEEDIENMINFIQEHAYDGFDTSFVSSLENNYQRHGKLTEKQLRGLKNVYDSIRRGNG